MSDNKFSLKRDKKSMPTMLMLVIRICVGAYLIYLAYQLKGAFGSPISGSTLFLMTAAVLFVFAGAVVIIFALKDLITGRYEGGALDTTSSEASADAPAEEPEDEFDPHNVTYKDQGHNTDDN